MDVNDQIAQIVARGDVRTDPLPETGDRARGGGDHPESSAAWGASVDPDAAAALALAPGRERPSGPVVEPPNALDLAGAGGHASRQG